MIGPIGLDRMNEVLSAVIPMLAPAFEADNWKVGVDDLRQMLTSGGFQLYIAFDVVRQEILAALVTEILQYPKAKVFSMAFCGGAELERWAPWIVGLEDLAREAGCRYTRIAGRRGWGRVFTDYQETHRIYEKDLRDLGSV